MYAWKMTSVLHTDGSVVEDDEQTGVVLPLDLVASVDVLPLGKGRMDVLCLEFLWETSQRQDACHRRGKASHRRHGRMR
jgi:hypothetical protein